MSLTPFHLAIQVRDIAESRHFYGAILGCEEGRSSSTWIDFDFFGHQVVVHLNENLESLAHQASSIVDSHSVPIPHFGVVLEFPEWKALASRLRAQDLNFLMEPTIRFEGLPGEQGTMFFLDPSGNALEFKAFANIDTELFAKDDVPRK